jgi:hypothetical protein
MSTTAIGTPFSDYIQKPGLFSADNMLQITEGLEGKLDYPYGSSGKQPAPTTIPEMTFEQFTDDLKTKPDMTDPDNSNKTMFDRFTEDQLRKYFLSKGGKL